MSRFDFNQPPFDSLTSAEQRELEERADIIFFADDDIILSPGDPVEALYVVIKGLVREMAGDEVIALYRAGRYLRRPRAGRLTTAPTALSCMKKRCCSACRATCCSPSPTRTRALVPISTPVSRKNSARWPNVLKQPRTANPAHRHRACGQQPPAGLRQRRHQRARRRQGIMKQKKVKSLLVQHSGQLGMFTTSDFRDIVLDDVPTSTPLAQRCRFGLFTVDIDDYLFNALLTMTRENIRLVVMENGEAVSILSQIDILSYFSNHSHLIAQRLERADSLDDLADIAQQITRLVHILSNHGVKAPQLGRLVQALNARLFERTGN
ncbi:CBS domain-containing protein [Paludibacterium denitrificans]|uniref:CBS domain-containing protein n=1 Tax=Paludibacterium denitrificans TaxID=2675226 RepID=UPI001E4AAFA2|nr:CBS domain-containing protein [Paludibacterium denitrificans]